jgi:predicted dehydrogenase
LSVAGPSGERALVVGLAGAGPWARRFTAPILAAGPETRLGGVWSRTASSAQRLAARHGVPAFDRYEDLVEACEAVACAVAPAAQVDLAVEAARRGRAVLLEKPIADTLDRARYLTDAVGDAGVGSLVVLTLRLDGSFDAFADACRAVRPSAAWAWWRSDAFTAAAATSPWRAEAGMVLDVGPHVASIVEPVLGPVVAVAGTRRDPATVALSFRHDDGVSSAVLAGTEAGGHDVGLGVSGAGGGLTYVPGPGDGSARAAGLRQGLVAAARGTGAADLDVRYGLHVQAVVDAAERALAGDGWVTVADIGG